jgi:hypothetical protein
MICHIDDRVSETFGDNLPETTVKPLQRSAFVDGLARGYIDLIPFKQALGISEDYKRMKDRASNAPNERIGRLLGQGTMLGVYASGVALLVDVAYHTYYLFQ